MTRLRPLRLRRVAPAVLAAFLACGPEEPELATSVRHEAAAFPALADDLFKPVLCTSSTTVGDVLGDPVTGNTERDVVGDATYPAFYRYGTATDIYFRMRIDDKPTRSNGGLVSSAYDILVDTDGDPTHYEYMLTADGNISGGSVVWVRNTTPSSDPARDSAETVVQTLTPATDYWEVHQAADGSSFHATADWFITIRLPKSLLSAVNPDLLTRPLVMWAGTAAANYQLNADFGCVTGLPTSLTDATYQQATLDPDGTPAAVADAAAASEDGAVTVDVLANDTGKRDTPLTVTIAAQPAHGAVVVNGDRTITYTPAANYAGPDSFQYTLTDAPTPAPQASSTATVSITVDPVNDSPAAVDDTAGAAQGFATTIFVLANDGDADGDTLSISAVTQGSHGTVAISGTTVRYTSAAGWSGLDTFTYTVSDGHGGTATATVQVTTSADSPPVAAGDSANIDEDGSATVSVLANDSDPDEDPLSIAGVGAAGHGSTSVSGTNVVYTPTANWSGTDSFTYTVSDGRGGTATATVQITVQPVADAPVAGDDAATLAEDGAATVAVLDNDADADGDTLSISAVIQGAHGTVSISGTDVVYTPAPNWHGTDSFTYTIGDGHGGTSTGTVSVTVTSVNDLPAAGDDAASLSEDGSATIAVLDNDTDADEDTLSVLAVTQGAHGTVTLSGTDVVYTPAANWHGTDSFTYTISDGHSGTATATVTVTVASVNDLPAAGADSASVSEDGSATVAVLDNDTDADGDELSVAAVTQGAHGAVAVSGTDLVYTPAADWHGTDSFTYTVGDGHGGTRTATVTVTVTSVNDAPDASADAASTDQDTAATVPVLANDADADDDELSVAAVTQGAHGTVSISGASVVYVPASGWYGSDAFTYTVSDGHGGTDTAGVTMTVRRVNHPPIAGSDAASTSEDAAATLSVLDDDADADGDTLSISAVTQGAHGAVTLSGTDVVYTPAPDWHGTDSFTYTVSDGHGGSDTATVTVVVSPVNDAPVAGADSASTSEDGSAAIPVLDNDADADEDALSISAVTQGAHGAVTIAGTDVLYTPAPDWHGTDSFTYTIGDGHGGTRTATVTVTVTSVNDAPDAGADSASIAEDGSAAIPVLDDDADADGDTLSISAVTQGAHGAVTLSGTDVVYTPAPDWHGTDSFTYTVSDGHGGSDNATVTVVVSPVNDAPVAGADSVTLDEDGSAAIPVLDNDADADEDTLSISAVTQGAHGAVTVSGSGVRYVPAHDWHGTDSFTYTAGDGHGGSDTATVSVTVTPIDEPPAAADDTASMAEDAAGGVNVAVLANDVLADGPAASSRVRIHADPSHGTAAVEPDASITYRPAADWNGTDSFTYELRDADGDVAVATVSITVTAVNDPPAPQDDAAAVLADGGPTPLDVLANDADVDGDTLAVSAVSQPAHGAVAIDGGRVTYTPALGYAGPDSFTYTVSDGHGGTAVVTVHVVVTADVEGTPVAADDDVTTLEDHEVTIPVLSNDAGLADAPLTVFITTAPLSGVAVVNPDGTITYTPAPDANGTFTLEYKVTDADDQSASAAVTIAVTPVYDAPTIDDDAVAVPAGPGGETLIDVLANDADPDGDPLTLVAVTQGDHGGTVVIEGGRIRYTPAPGFHGTETFTYTVSDGQGGTSTGTVTVRVGDDAGDVPLGAAGGGCASGGPGGGATLALGLLLALALRRRRAAR